jgi:imidazolonepropionase-like amidohydrolase
MLLWLPLLLSGCPASQDPTQREPSLEPGDIWVKDVTVVSPEREVPLEHGNVIVRDGRILSVGTDAPQVNTSATVIDGVGKYLTPGLIDGHVHLAQVPGMTLEQEAAMPAIADALFSTPT